MWKYLPKRMVIEGESLVVCEFPGGKMGLASGTELSIPRAGSQNRLWNAIRRHFRFTPSSSTPMQVCVPPGAYLILTGIPGALQQRFGLEEVEGAVFVQSERDASGTLEELRFNNGVQITLQDLHEGQRIEVLSLASSHPLVVERELSVIEEELQTR